MTRNRLILTLMLALLPLGAAHALPEDRDKPVNIVAESQSRDGITGIITYSGNVKLTQGALKITADAIKVIYKDNKVDAISAIGKPTQFTDIPTADQPPVVINGNLIEYHPIKQILRITGNAQLTQSGSEINAAVIEFNTATQVSSAKGGVSSVIQPNQTNKKE